MDRRAGGPRVIEHDMPLVMAISDRIYCLEAGVIIAEGSPDSVRNDSRVIASYLGTDEQAIARSGARGRPRIRVSGIATTGRTAGTASRNRSAGWI